MEGPLLPENLDVRGIPFQQLTIALSGETYLLAFPVHSGSWCAVAVTSKRCFVKLLNRTVTIIYTDASVKAIVHIGIWTRCRANTIK